MPNNTKYATLAALAGIVGLTLAACGSANSSSTTSSDPGAASTSSSASKTPTFASLETPPATNVSLSEAGSTLLQPLFNIWAPAYEKQYSNIKVTPSGGGSGAGISGAAGGTVDIGASDAYLSSSQTTKTPSLLNIPLAISAQMVNYNIPGITGNLKLNGQILASIYEGKITNWDNSAISAINPGVKLPNLKIVPLHRSDGSGDTFIFTQYLSKADPNGWGSANGPQFGTTVAFPSVPSALGENGNGGMVSACQTTVGCVAYIGVSFKAQTDSAKLGEAALGNAAGNYLLPNPQTIGAEAASLVSKTPASEALSLVYGPDPNGYPIINYEYAIVNSEQPAADKAQAIRALLAWAIDPQYGNAPSYIDQVNFQPLPSSVAALSLAQIAKIK
ncbi:MAG: phosphate ABC transporter substrate-binding protein PstS [Actinomycetota bacterium]|nr:MAG: phosphate ABC transporter substrate-binding protein PstS [Actinomycetota bacterium]